MPAHPRLVSGFIAVLLVLMAIDGLPSFGSVHDHVRRTVDPVLDWTGLWQGNWELFAPEPDKINVMVTADVWYADGTHAVWRSPDWAPMTAFEKLTHFRQMEFVDAVRNDSNAGAWPALAAFAARDLRGGDDALPVRVAVTRHWTVIPPPTGAPTQPLPAPAPARVDRENTYDGHYRIYRWSRER